MIPLVDLSLDYYSHKKEIEKVIGEVLKSGWFILGPKVLEFESNFANYIGVKEAIAVASGTEALQLSLLACGIRPDDGVILPVNAYPTAFAVASTGANLQLVDIDKETYLLDPEKAEKAINRKTKAIITVHLYGQPARMVFFKKLAEKYNLSLIEDCAQAHGAAYKKEMVGSIGKCGCFSFYPTKNLGGYGDGGMVVTNKQKISQRLRRLRNYGEKNRYESLELGINSRLDEIQAAILNMKL